MRKTEVTLELEPLVQVFSQSKAILLLVVANFNEMRLFFKRKTKHINDLNNFIS